DTGRTVQLRPDAPNRNHEGGVAPVTEHADPGGLVGAADARHPSDADVDKGGRASAGRVRRNGRAGEETGGHPVRDLAGRDDVHAPAGSSSGGAADADVETPAADRSRSGRRRRQGQARDASAFGALDRVADPSELAIMPE